jgi:predicted ATPase
MVVAIYRPEYSSTWPNWSYHTPVVLKPLDSLHIENIIKTIWKVDYLPDGFGSLIQEHTAGNPFFIEEVCTALMEEGTVRFENRKAVFMRPLGLPLLAESLPPAYLSEYSILANDYLRRWKH